jgi:protocatechuate 3,4-dioxygenase beta subunit
MLAWRAILLGVGLVLLVSGAAPARGADPVGGPCEGCELARVDMPTDLAAEARIAPAEERGERLLIEGTVRAADGRSPAAGIVVYAYHTDAGGHYPPARAANGRRIQHGRLRGWARTGRDGRYRFATIRPAPYPGRDVPAHVHMLLIEPGLPPYYLDDLVFSDDALVDATWRAGQAQRGGSGIVTPQRGVDGTWHARRDIYVGRNIPNHPR